jgi:DNA-binding CsgD family transcriptional regulator
MENLTQKDWHLLTRAIEQLNSDFDPKSLSARSLKAVSGLVRGDVNSFDFFTNNEKYDSTAWHDLGDILTDDIMEVFAKYIHQHPLVPISLANPDLGALKMTDVITQKKFEKTGLYNEFYRQLRVRYQMGMSLPVAPDLTLCCVVTRGNKDFSERDKTIVTLAGPHIINAVRNALAYERLSKTLETTACGIISLDSCGKTVFMSEFAQKLCEKYFAGEKRASNSRLPETLDQWLDYNSLVAGKMLNKINPKPLKIENQNGILYIRLMDNSATGEKTVLLEEKTFNSPKMFERLPVTPREAEILFWITQGKTDAVIGLLCGISPRTVQKHVENIYVKLAVETRTAAMLRAFEAL